MNRFPPAEVMCALLEFADKLEQVRAWDRIRSALLPEFAQRQLAADETSICCVRAGKSKAKRLFVASVKASRRPHACDRNHTRCRVRSFILPPTADSAARIVCVGRIKRTGDIACMVCVRRESAFTKPELRVAHMAFEYAFHSAADELAKSGAWRGARRSASSPDAEKPLIKQSTREAVLELKRLFNQ